LSEPRIGPTKCDDEISKPQEASMNILLIEDDDLVARSLGMMLRHEGFALQTARLGQQGIELLKLHNFDLVLLDLNLPDMSGMEVLRILRDGGADTPIMVLSGTAEMATKVAMLAGGADDYVTKPFNRDELVARLHAVLRRSEKPALSMIKTGDLTINLADKSIEANGVRIDVTSKEYQIFEILSLRKGATLSKNVFINYLYDGRDEPEAKIIDVFICKLRKKLMVANRGRHYIETVWGQGYKLLDPSERAEEPKAA
jgi:two-component system cell cycle response regulator CtrA